MNNEIKPAKKLLPMVWGINKATRKATMAILHQGRNSPAMKLNSMIRSIEEIKRMYRNFKLLRNS
jgi:hypothetical protein